MQAQTIAVRKRLKLWQADFVVDFDCDISDPIGQEFILAARKMNPAVPEKNKLVTMAQNSRAMRDQQRCCILARAHLNQIDPKSQA